MNAIRAIKKYINFILVFLLTLTVFPCKLTTAHAEKLPDPAVVIFSEKHDRDEIEVTATLRSNPGVSDAMFTLKYNNEALEMIGYETGDALASLDFTPTPSLETYPFVFLFDSFMATRIDDSTGVLFSVRFKIKDTAQDGEYTVGVTSSVDCVDKGVIYEVKVISDMASFSIVDKQVANVIVDVDPDASGDDGAPQYNNKRKNSVIIIIITSAVVVVALLAIFITLMIIKRKRDKGAEAWIKL